YVEDETARQLFDAAAGDGARRSAAIEWAEIFSLVAVREEFASVACAAVDQHDAASLERLWGGTARAVAAPGCFDIATARTGEDREEMFGDARLPADLHTIVDDECVEDVIGPAVPAGRVVAAAHKAAFVIAVRAARGVDICEG